MFVFRAGEKQYKILEQPQERTVDRIAQIVKHEAAQPPPPPPGAGTQHACHAVYAADRQLTFGSALVTGSDLYEV